MSRKGNRWSLNGSMLKNSKLINKYRGNSKKLKYYDQLLKKHNFWDKQPTLRDDMKQI